MAEKQDDEQIRDDRAEEEPVADGGRSVSAGNLWSGVREHPVVEEAVDRFGPYATPVFFAGGVVFDAVTLGRNLSIWMLGYVFLYVIGVAVCMVLQARDWFDDRQEWIDRALHFCLGATFSALVVLYFRSATYLYSWLTVGLLVGVMVWNEIAAKGQPKRSVVWAVYAASLVMLFNFLLPFVFGTISSFWFYASLVLVMGALVGLRHVARIPPMSLAVSGVFAVLLAGLYLAGAIPPVPLVMRQNIACVNGHYADGEYVCKGERQGLLVRWGFATPDVRYRPGEKVSVLSAVSAPRGVSATLEHRWARRVGESWKTYDTIEVQMSGGREHGWRFYSFKRNVVPGRWRVTTAVPDGRVVGYMRFDLEKVGRGEELERSRLRLE